MDVFAEYLDAHDKPCDWRPVELPPAERLLKFDAWLYRRLADRIDWTWAGDTVAQGRRINQARNYVERMVLALWRRGWLLDGSRLAKHILAPLDTIADYQKRGQVEDFWPYFCATVDRYVGVNSEEIQIEAKRIGASMAPVLSQLTQILAQRTATMPELLAQRAEEVANANELTLREKQAALRKKEAVSKEEKKQMTLF